MITISVYQDVNERPYRWKSGLALRSKSPNGGHCSAMIVDGLPYWNSKSIFSPTFRNV